VVLQWNFGPDVLAVDVSGAGFAVDGIVARRHPAAPSAPRGELGLFATDAGVRIGDRVSRVTALHGQPSARATTRATFQAPPAGARPTVDVERWDFRAGLLIEISDGRVVGIGVRHADTAAPTGGPPRSAESR
jgi:hypothetical protein